jgi:hypothetical protein
MFGIKKQIKNIIFFDVSPEKLREFCIFCRYYISHCDYNKKSTNYYMKDLKSPGTTLENNVYFFDGNTTSINWSHDLFFLLINNIFYTIFVTENRNQITSFQIDEVALFNSRIAFDLDNAYGIRYKTMEEKETELFSINNYIRKGKELEKLNMNYFNQQFPQIYKNLRQKLYI